jgi:diguanylate cyclase (GGDEF)-like protein
MTSPYGEKMNIARPVLAALGRRGQSSPMHSFAVVANLALSISLLALTLSTLRGARMPARMRSWMFFSIASLTLVAHAVLDAFSLPVATEVGDLFEVATLAFLAVGFALLYGADRERLSRLEGEAERDPNTGLYNRRAFRTIVAKRLARPLPGARAAVALLDLDGFKQVNDEHGHPRGDQLLQLVAASLRANLRTQDVAARYGGDEFVVYFEGCGVVDAERVLQRVRTSVASMSAIGGTRITLSAGLAGYPDAARELDALVRIADRALIDGKQLGKDQVKIASV